MPTSIREQLLAAATAKLAAISGITGLTVERNRRDGVEDFPMIVARDGGSLISERLTYADRMIVTIDAECYASASSGAAAGIALDVLLAAAQAALFADRTLGVGGFDVRLLDAGDPLFDVSDVAGIVASLTARFELEAWVKPDDPYNLAP